MSLFRNLAPASPEGDGPRFRHGEIDHTRPDGAHIRADMFPRGDGKVSWSARVTWSPIEDDPHAPAPRSEATGPHLVDDEATAERDALAWIRGRL